MYLQDKQMRCSLSKKIMIKPVQTIDGYVFEEEVISEYLRYNNENPITKKQLESKILVPNLILQQMIQGFLRENPELYDQNEVYLPKLWIKQMFEQINEKNYNTIEQLLQQDFRLLFAQKDKQSIFYLMSSDEKLRNIMQSSILNQQQRLVQRINGIKQFILDQHEIIRENIQLKKIQLEFKIMQSVQDYNLDTYQLNEQQNRKQNLIIQDPSLEKIISNQSNKQVKNLYNDLITKQQTIEQNIEHSQEMQNSHINIIISNVNETSQKQQKFDDQQSFDTEQIKCEQFTIHDKPIKKIINYDNGGIISASWDGKIKIWSGQIELINEIEAHSDYVFDIQLWNQNELISCSQDKTIKFWNLDNLICIKTIKTSQVQAILRISEYILYFASNSSIIKLKIDESTQKVLSGHSDYVNCLTIFDDKLLSGSFDCKIKVWNINTDDCLKTLESHSHFVMTLLATNNFFISGSEDKTIKIWNQDFENTDTLEGHQDAVSCLQLIKSENLENLLISGSDDNTLNIWDLQTKKIVKTLKKHTSSVFTIVQQKNGNIISGSADRTIVVWNN